jgi:hypothetical protein
MKFTFDFVKFARLGAAAIAALALAYLLWNAV